MLFVCYDLWPICKGVFSDKCSIIQQWYFKFYMNRKWEMEITREVEKCHRDIFLHMYIYRNSQGPQRFPKIEMSDKIHDMRLKGVQFWSMVYIDAYGSPSSMAIMFVNV